MPRLLLLMSTTTYRAHDFLEAARRLGVEVVIGSDQPQALAALTPGTTLTLDFVHPEDGAQTIVEAAKKRSFTAIVAVDDEGTMVAAMASERLGLSHNSVASVEASRNKYRMRQLLTEAGLPAPAFWCCAVEADVAAVASEIRFPCVLKPLFLSASRGVMRADDPHQFAVAFKRLAALLRTPDVAARGGTLAGQILIETFISGREVALEGLLIRGDLKVLALFDKPDQPDGPFFEETLYVTPSRLPMAVQDRIISCTDQTAKALGLREGPIHAELRVQDHHPCMLEIAPRSIGGLCSRTLRFGANTSLEELILQRALGHDPVSMEREQGASGVMMLPIPHGGVLRAVRGQEAAKHVPGIEALDLTIPIGQTVVPLPEGSRYLGFLFARAATPEDVEAALRKAHQQLEFDIVPADPDPDTPRDTPPESPL